MSLTSKRHIVIQFSGDFEFAESFQADDNTTAMGHVQYVTLASGANTITAPVVSGKTFTAVTIIPPASNTTNITLKGVTGDTGVQIHDEGPCSLSLDPAVTSFVLTAAAEISGVRLIWT